MIIDACKKDRLLEKFVKARVNKTGLELSYEEVYELCYCVALGRTADELAVSMLHLEETYQKYSEEIK